jgi:hypothetical protein
VRRNVIQNGMIKRSGLGICSALVAFCVGSCSSGIENHATSPASSFATTTELAATTSTIASSQRGVLHVIGVSGRACPPHIDSPAAITVAFGTVRALLLCPLATPRLMSTAVTITASDPKFAALIKALSAPNEPRTSQACPMYADVPQIVIAETVDSAYQVLIPTDACGHYQRGALTTLNRARQP